VYCPFWGLALECGLGKRCDVVSFCRGLKKLKKPRMYSRGSTEGESFVWSTVTILISHTI
jgi:hypothetical protein